jgi:hypothetical protein
MIAETVTTTLRHYFDKYSDIPLKAEAFTVPTLNYILHQWEKTKADVVVQGSNGKLYSIENIGIESKQFSGTETCILLTLSPI